MNGSACGSGRSTWTSTRASTSPAWDPSSTPRRSPTRSRARTSTPSRASPAATTAGSTTTRPLHPERRHPHLERDLLREQIEACHARGIRVPIYTTVQWDHLTAAEHPEWRIVTPEGALEGTPPFEAGFYRKLCLNSPYVELLQAHTRDIQDTLPVDGLFFDIVQATPCVCRWCLAGMAEAGLDPEDPAARDGVRARDDRPLPDRACRRSCARRRPTRRSSTTPATSARTCAPPPAPTRTSSWSRCRAASGATSTSR